jgi:KDO2-lipid IV(A) lauroyltransferase
MSFINYLLFRCFAFFIAFLPYSWIEVLGKKLGLAIYHLYPRYRKRALSNLAIASKLHLSNADIVRLAKESIQSLAITFLQYPKLACENDIHRIAVCENPEVATSLNGVIFFCGHQANWEVLFLEGSSRMPGIAIGRPIKNRWLYSWCVRMREKFGGKIIPPKNAVKESLRALKEGKFVGIVGDQGMPDSGFCSPFLGKPAWTSPLPALLAIKTRKPIVVATVRREYGKYILHYSDPIWPEGKTAEELMKTVLALFEKSVMERPGEWMWIHNRWKQRPPGELPRKLRHDTIAIILDGNFALLDRLLSLFPREFLTLFIPKNTSLHLGERDNLEIIPYERPEELFVEDYRFKLVINLTKYQQLKPHFLNLSTFEVIDDPSLFL